MCSERASSRTPRPRQTRDESTRIRSFQRGHHIEIAPVKTQTIGTSPTLHDHRAPNLSEQAMYSPFATTSTTSRVAVRIYGERPLSSYCDGAPMLMPTASRRIPVHTEETQTPLTDTHKLIHTQTEREREREMETCSTTEHTEGGKAHRAYPLYKQHIILNFERQQ